MTDVRGIPPETKLCRGCRYVLEGLSELRCPECGRAFDPDDPQTFWTSEELRNRRTTRMVLLIIWGPLVLFALYCVYGAMEWTRKP